MKVFSVSLSFLLFGSACLAQQEKYETMSHRDFALILNYPTMIEKLEISQDQLDELKRIQVELTKSVLEQRQMTKVEERLNFEDDNEEFKKFWETQQKKLNEDYVSKFDSHAEKVLSAQQLASAKEMLAWNTLNSGVIPMLTLSRLRQYLKIEARQASKIEEAGKEMADDFEKDLAALRKKYRERLEAKLTDQQRKSLHKLLGEPSDIDYLKDEYRFPF